MSCSGIDRLLKIVGIVVLGVKGLGVRREISGGWGGMKGVAKIRGGRIDRVRNVREKISRRKRGESIFCCWWVSRLGFWEVRGVGNLFCVDVMDKMGVGGKRRRDLMSSLHTTPTYFSVEASLSYPVAFAKRS